MTCSFSKEFSLSAVTAVENEFITKYLPNSDGNAVKVYLYGLFLCAHPELDKSLPAIANELLVSEDEVKNAFAFWENQGILSVISKDPYQVQYFSPKNAYSVKPRIYKKEKYEEFSKTIQIEMPNRMISPSEYTEYYNFVETYSFSTDALLLIIKYCVSLKGQDIGYKYILATAKNFIDKGLNTAEKVQEELSSYLIYSSQLANILNELSSTRKPDIEDKQLFDKWTKDLSFEYENILFAAKTLKKGSIKKLDDFITELYELKYFSKEEIEEYSKKKKQLYDLTLKINKALSIYVEVVSTEIENYVSKWISYGFNDETLLLIANKCFIRGKTSLVEMNELVIKLKENGAVNISSVGDYFENEKKTDEFIKKILAILGLSRRPTPWDRDNMAVWKNWNFDDDMIIKAAEMSAGKTSAVAYMNSILSNWKNKEIFVMDEVNSSSVSETNQEEYNREYERRRAIALSRSQKNIDKALQIEGFSPVYERTFSIEKDLAIAEVSENKELLQSLEKEKTEVIKKANDLLSTIKLKLDDLSPHFACEKCKDTGYVGTNRCDCFNKKV